MSYRLYIPGPLTVSESIIKAMGKPMIGHRSKDFVALYEDMQPRLQKMFFTTDPVYLGTSSAWGVMEGALRNVCKKGVLNCMNGAFSDKWFDVAKRCGKYAEALQFDWGKPVDPEAVRKALATGKFDCITFIHSETSTGTLSNIAEIMAVIREFPDVISIADSVSSFSTLPIKKDELGIDILLTGSQKALALPPGLAIFSVSERARARAKELSDRGYYFDLIEFHDNHTKGMTPSTPCISLFYGLQQRLVEVESEGLENRYERHRRLNEMVRNWGLAKGFSLLPSPEFATRGLNCFKNDRNADLERLLKTLKSRHKLVIDGGYGKLKGKTFRISNMGDETDATIATLIAALDDSFAEQGI
jgi:aspartate aminotransferase-like enzyme